MFLSVRPTIVDANVRLIARVACIIVGSISNVCMVNLHVYMRTQRAQKVSVCGRSFLTPDCCTHSGILTCKNVRLVKAIE